MLSFFLLGAACRGEKRRPPDFDRGFESSFDTISVSDFYRVVVWRELVLCFFTVWYLPFFVEDIPETTGIARILSWTSTNR